jgi:hypothetical protein
MGTVKAFRLKYYQFAPFFIRVVWKPQVSERQARLVQLPLKMWFCKAFSPALAEGF